MAYNKSQVATLYNALNTTDRAALIAAAAATTGLDRPEDVANSVLLVLQKLSQ